MQCTKRTPLPPAPHPKQACAGHAARLADVVVCCGNPGTALPADGSAELTAALPAGICSDRVGCVRQRL